MYTGVTGSIVVVKVVQGGTPWLLTGQILTCATKAIERERAMRDGY